MDMDRRFRQVQRHTTARSVFDWIALICLGASVCFWLTLHWAWLSPPALLSMQSIVAIVMGLIYALVTPLLWSAMAPSTPAGMMLQRTQTRTWGFVVMIAACGFLTWHGGRLIWAWWMAQPNVSATGEAMSLAMACVIGFVAIPALAWTATTPERWAQQVAQAHAVKKLQLQQAGELAIIKASIVRAETLAAIGWANLLPVEKEEAVQTLRGLLMASSDSMRSVVRTLGLSADLERSITNDDEIADQLEYVTSTIDILPDLRVSAPPRGDTAGIPAPQRPAAPRSAPQRYAVEYAAAAVAFKAMPFTVAALAELLDMKERTARDRLNAWLSDGRAKDSDTKGHYYLTECEVR